MAKLCQMFILWKLFQKVGDKIQFQYGLIDLWEFFCELVEIIDEKPAVNYPITVLDSVMFL